MAIKNKAKPVTPSLRYHKPVERNVANKRPERGLTESKHRKKGRNTYGRITSRRRGGREFGDPKRPRAVAATAGH